jgi:hypothetical protein
MAFSGFQRWQLSFRTFIAGLGAIATVLLLVGSFALWQLLAQSPLTLLSGMNQSSPSAAIFIPPQAPLMVSLLSSPEQLLSLRRALTPPGQRRQAQTSWQQLKQTLQQTTGLNYDTEIRPWIGSEITFAITDTDFDHIPENGHQPGYLLAIATRDSDRAREFLELFWQRQAVAGRALVFETINGSRTIYAQPAPVPSAAEAVTDGDLTDLDTAFRLRSGSLASAVVGQRFVLLANHPRVLQQSIRNAQAAQHNLTQQRSYQQALETLTPHRIGIGYMNLPQLLNWSGIAPPPPTPFTPAPTPYLQSLTAALAINPQGLRLNTLLTPRPGSRFPEQSPAVSQTIAALQYLPADTAWAAAGKDLPQLWRQSLTELRHYPDGPGQLRDRLLSPLGEQIFQNLQGWLTEEYALGYLPATGWILAAERTPETDHALRELDRLAAAQSLTVSPLSLGPQTVTAWSRFKTRTEGRFRNRETTVETEIVGLHTQVGPYEIFTTSLPAMTAALAAPEQPLQDDPGFSRTIAALERPNDGYFYANGARLRPPLIAALPWLRLIDTPTQPLVAQLESLAVSSYGSTTTQKPADVIIHLVDP